MFTVFYSYYRTHQDPIKEQWLESTLTMSFIWSITFFILLFQLYTIITTWLQTSHVYSTVLQADKQYKLNYSDLNTVQLYTCTTEITSG